VVVPYVEGCVGLDKVQQGTNRISGGGGFSRKVVFETASHPALFVLLKHNQSQTALHCPGVSKKSDNSHSCSLLLV